MDKGRSWVEIDLSTIAKNYKLYCNSLPICLPIMAVVKADAYGHGDLQIASHLQSLGVSNFAVSNIDEAIKLRESGLKGQILILGFTPPRFADDIKKYDITQALISEEYAESLRGSAIKAHIALDTGMNRVGFDADDSDLCEAIIRKYNKEFRLTGLFSHLCVADTPVESQFTETQIKKFETVCARVSDLKLPYIHILNSAGGLWQRPYGNMVRLGIILYGLKPDYSNQLPVGIKQALTWKSVVSMVKTVNVGESIGYGRTYKVDHPIRIATIPTGYADGYSRELSNNGYVIIHNMKAPIVGNVCMDQMMVDVSSIPDVKAEDEVILTNSDYTADELAQTIGTIGYEIVCGISKRVPRFYK